MLLAKFLTLINGGRGFEEIERLKTNNRNGRLMLVFIGSH